MKRWVSILPGVCASVVVLPAWSGPYNNPLGFYLGGGIGSSNLGESGYYSCYGYYGCSYWHNTGWKVFGGIRPTPFLGAQLEYTDFGHSSVGPYYYPPIYSGDIGAHAASAFAVGYLPLPYFMDLYAKVGASALWSHADFNGYCGQGFSQICATGSMQDSATAEFGYGGGFQWRFASFAVRLEYERIGTESHSPDLLSADFAFIF